MHPEDSVPHTLVERDGKLYGPGAFDMKAGLITIELALKALKAADLLQRIPLKVVINSAEEAGTVEPKAFMAKCAAGARAALVFEFGRDGGGIVVSRKGMFKGEIPMSDTSAHAGNAAQQGVNAIEELCALIVPLSQAMRSTEDDTSFNLGTIAGGTAANVIAASAEVTFETRSASLSGIDRALACLEWHRTTYRGAGTPSFNIRPHMPPLEETEASLKLAADYIVAGEKAGLDLKVLPRQGGLSDANWVEGRSHRRHDT